MEPQYLIWHHLIKAKSSDQYKLKARAKKDKKYKKKKPEYYAMIDNRILIATKANIGNKLKVSVGDYVNVKFKRSEEHTSELQSHA